MVSDHINHFTEQSIYWMAEEFGFEVQIFDEVSHRGAFCVSMKKSQRRKKRRLATIDYKEIKQSLDYWPAAKFFIRSLLLEKKISNLCIYGGGFYGSYLSTWLSNFVTIDSFYDSNPYLVGEAINGIPVKSIQDITVSEEILVALNPLIAETFKRNLIEENKLNHERVHALPKPEFN